MATNVPEDEWRRQTHCFVVQLWKSLKSRLLAAEQCFELLQILAGLVKTVAFNSKYSFKGKDCLCDSDLYFWVQIAEEGHQKSSIFVCV